MKKKPIYSDVKFDVSDLDLRKHRLKNKASDKELKPRMNELKPCPFCGYIYIEEISGINEGFYIVCPNCKIMTDYYNSIELLTKAWNARPESAWEMFRGLYIKYRAVKIIPPLAEITRCAHLDSIMLSFIENNSEQEAKGKLQELEKEFKE